MHVFEGNGLILGGSNNEISLAFLVEKHFILPCAIELEWRSSGDDHDSAIPATLRR